MSSNKNGDLTILKSMVNVLTFALSLAVVTSLSFIYINSLQSKIEEEAGYERRVAEGLKLYQGCSESFMGKAMCDRLYPEAVERLREASEALTNPPVE